MTELRPDLLDYIKAGFSGIWVRSMELEDVVAELQELCVEQKWAAGQWDFDAGLQPLTEDFAKLRNTFDPPPRNNPKSIWYDKKVYQLIRDAGHMAAQLEKPRMVVVIKNFHRNEMSTSTAVIQAIQNSVFAGKSAEFAWCFVILAPESEVPTEIGPDFAVLEHKLPDKEQLWEIAESIGEKDELPKGEKKLRMLDAASGLTRRAAENAFSLTIVRKSPFDPTMIWDLKSQILRQRGFLSIYDGKETFKQLGGYFQFKEFTANLLEKRTDNPLLFPRGVLLLGVPGAGKSAAVKALGNETGRRVLVLHAGALRSRYQGDTDKNVREALEIADRMAPCILFVDEIEKALSGTESSGMTDGGTGARLFGTLLTWLNDHTSDVLFAGTSNDISKLPPEFSRAERFDGIRTVLPGGDVGVTKPFNCKDPLTLRARATCSQAA